MGKIIALTPRQKDVLALLEGRDDGVSSAELGLTLGLSTSYACEVLRSLRDLGLAACSSTGRFARWGLPMIVAALRASNTAAAAQASQARAAARKAAAELEAEAFSSRPLDHKTTSAADAPPIKCLGQASIFHIAASHQPTTPRPSRRIPTGEPA